MNRGAPWMFVWFPTVLACSAPTTGRVLPANALAQPSSSPSLPEGVQPPAGQSVALALTGTGAQVYECREDPGKGFAWTLSGVHADLTDAAGQTVGRHFNGPTWEHRDGSTVVGEKMASADAPEPNAIPWLLLSVKQAHGAGTFGDVLTVVRANTSGGKPPSTVCDAKSGPLEVPYRATYYFFRGHR